ncbi:MAG: hypothetical protein ACHQNT_12780 [Bacteroidia bacterium]
MKTENVINRKTWQLFVNLVDLTGTRIDEWYIKRIDDTYKITFINSNKHPVNFKECELQPGVYEFDAVIVPRKLLPYLTRRVKKLARKHREKVKPKKLLSGLQVQILKLKEEGCTNTEVGDSVHRSADAVKKQIYRMYDKFHVRHRLNALLRKVRWML